MKRSVRTVACAVLALIAFAANSVLCRLALRDAAVDPATFTTIRILSGAVTLMLVAWATGADRSGALGSWKPAMLLSLYAVSFAFAYVSLSAGVGALILFGSVQVTMLFAAVSQGERPHPLQWLGVVVALGGLVYLVRPGLSAPPFGGAALMSSAGVSWGFYSLSGRGAQNPLTQTTSNFARALPMVMLISMAWLPRIHFEPRGAALAIASGSVASGLGYVVWFTALRGLTAVRAAVVQLAVPILAAAGGVIVLAEPVPARLPIASMLVLGGIAVTIVGRDRSSRAAAVV